MKEKRKRGDRWALRFALGMLLAVVIYVIALWFSCAAFRALVWTFPAAA